MGRFARSWHLTVRSFRVLRKDKELMLLPAISGLCILLVSATFVIPMLGTNVDKAADKQSSVQLLAALLFYIVAYTIAFFFQAAVVAGATERMSGGDPTLKSSLGAASRRLPSILLWGVIAGTVGFVIRTLQERSELLGKIILGLIGVAWSLATFFMAPVLVLENDGIGASFKRSWNTFKKTWGETVVGAAGIGLVSFLALLIVFAVAGAIYAAGLTWVAIVLGVLGVLAVMLVSSTLQGIYVAALYRYATTGEVPTGYDPALMESAFAEKKRPRRIFS